MESVDIVNPDQKGSKMKYWKAVRKTDRKGIYETGGIGGSIKTEFKVGKTYEVSGKPELCKNGFHFYKAKDFVFGIDLFGDDTRFLEIEPLLEIIKDTEKCISTKIKIVRDVPVKEWKHLVKKNRNSGDYNSGDHNSGNHNSGNHNSGYRNSGYRNSGDRNSGNHNSGYRNSGDYNSGYRNSGNHNSGYRNSGNHNSGDRNSGYRNSGDRNSGDYNRGHGYLNYFCTETRYFLFDTEVSKETIEKVNRIPVYEWFNLDDKSYHKAWEACPEEHLKLFSKIKEFQTEEAKKKFKQITGRNL